jgi:hypothetical protein
MARMAGNDVNRSSGGRVAHCREASINVAMLFRLLLGSHPRFENDARLMLREHESIREYRRRAEHVDAAAFPQRIQKPERCGSDRRPVTY